LKRLDLEGDSESMIISISGLPGSGKTTVGKLLAKRLGFRFYSIGDLRGRMAMERDLTIDQLNELGMKEKWTDEEADEYQKRLGEKEDNFVIESRLGFYFIPKSVKIFLEVDQTKAAERIFRAQRPDEKRKTTIEEVIDSIRKRMKSDETRYQKYYKVDFLDKSHYDIVIDTTGLTPEQVAERIIERIKKIKSR
jgi:predicted cytidylate kinase